MVWKWAKCEVVGKWGGGKSKFQKKVRAACHQGGYLVPGHGTGHHLQREKCRRAAWYSWGWGKTIAVKLWRSSKGVTTAAHGASCLVPGPGCGRRKSSQQEGLCAMLCWWKSTPHPNLPPSGVHTASCQEPRHSTGSSSGREQERRETGGGKSLQIRRFVTMRQSCSQVRKWPWERERDSRSVSVHMCVCVCVCVCWCTCVCTGGSRALAIVAKWTAPGMLIQQLISHLIYYVNEMGKQFPVFHRYH